MVALHCPGKSLGSLGSPAELAADTNDRCQAPPKELAECPEQMGDSLSVTALSCLMNGDAQHQEAEPGTGPLQLSGCCTASETMHLSCYLASPVQQWTLPLCSPWPLWCLPLCLGQQCLARLYWCERRFFSVACRASRLCQRPDDVTQPASSNRGVQVSPYTGWEECMS